MNGLKKMTVGELLDSDDFKKELEIQIANECEHHDKLAREAFTKGLRLQRAPIARLRERDVFNVEDMVAAYKLMLAKMLQDFSAAEREYIKQVCMVAYWRVVQKRKAEEAKEEKKIQ